MPADPYRDFTYPLNVFMHILTHEEGEVAALHYGFFERPDEGIAVAQQRSTAMLMERLPPPPARILDVGAGVGSTLTRLTRGGWVAVGITPDATQVALIRGRYADELDVRCMAFESLSDGEPFDTVIFQESSQYIASEALWRVARSITRHVVVLDEFTLQPLEEAGALHSLDGFLDEASRAGFEQFEEVDVSAKAAPTMEYFATRIPAYREALQRDLGITDEEIDRLIASGARYRERYAMGVYGYRVMQFQLR